MAIPTLRSANYRGVPFGVRASEDTTGRRLQEDEIPGRDTPIVRDFGRRGRVLTFDAFVVGADYLERAERLVDVCAERDTPGRLSLPYMQSTVVRPRECLRRESADDRGVARFQLTFVEVERLPAPTVRTGGQQALDAAATAVAAAAETVMVEDLTVTGVPNGVLTAAGDEVARAGAALQAIGAVRSATERAVTLARNAAQLVRDAQQLVLEPIMLGALLSESVEMVAATIGDAAASLNAYRDLASLVPRVHKDYLSTRNAKLVGDLTHFAAIAGWARAAGRVQWATYEDAVTARRRIEDDLDLVSGSIDDRVFASLAELRARLALQVPPPDRKLPHLRTLTLEHRTSAVLLAYRLYDDTTRAGEIVARNRIRHPSFLPVRVPLQVLTNA